MRMEGQLKHAERLEHLLKDTVYTQPRGLAVIRLYCMHWPIAPSCTARSTTAVFAVAFILTSIHRHRTYKT